VNTESGGNAYPVRVTDPRASERLLELIGDEAAAIVEGTDQAAGRAAKIVEAVLELRRRGDTVVRPDDLLLIAAAANHGRKYGPEGDTDYTGFNAALERIQNALGGTL
jgi:hypothetical protein